MVISLDSCVIFEERSINYVGITLAMHCKAETDCTFSATVSSRTGTIASQY